MTLEAQEPLRRAGRAARSASGIVKVALEGKPVAEFPLIALEEVPLGELLRPRMGHGAAVVQELIEPRREAQ